MMYYIICVFVGLILGSLFIVIARKLSPNGEKVFLAQALWIAALIYIGFALAWGDMYWLGIESLGVLAYGIFAYLGYRYSAIWVGLGWLVHPLWDAVLHLYGAGHAIAPDWYVIACISFDVLVGAYILTNLSRYSTSNKTKNIAIKKA